jgi:hypothetical protein
VKTPHPHTCSQAPTPLTAEEQVWYDKLRKRFPNKKAGTLRTNARRLAKGKFAPILAAVPAREAVPEHSNTDGLPDGAAYWWGAKGHERTIKAKPARPGRPEIRPEDLK